MKLLVKTLCGVEDMLAKELEKIGATNVATQRRAVECEADLATMYKINLWSRLALRVLVPVLEFKAETDADVYEAVYNFDWQEWIAPSKTILFDHVSFSGKFPDSQFLALRAKDALVDKIREKTGSRPSVDAEYPDVLLSIHVTDELVTVSLDASGSSLNRRGYRNTQLPSATNEVLAAALVECSGWTPDEPLIDPMCGCGTICIEAAMKARNIAPNLYRTEAFAFMNWKTFDEQLWNDILKEADASPNKCRLNIIGSDVDPDALDIAKISTLEIGLNREVRIQRRALREMERTTQSGYIITVPPYIQEESKRSLDDLYKEITYYFSHQYPDHDAWIYSTNLKALRAIEFRSEKKFEIYNGSQEGNFNLYPF